MLPSKRVDNTLFALTIGYASQFWVPEGIVVSVSDQLGVGDTGHEAFCWGRRVGFGSIQGLEAGMQMLTQQGEIMVRVRCQERRAAYFVRRIQSATREGKYSSGKLSK